MRNQFRGSGKIHKNSKIYCPQNFPLYGTLYHQGETQVTWATNVHKTSHETPVQSIVTLEDSFPLHNKGSKGTTPVTSHRHMKLKN